MGISIENIYMYIYTLPVSDDTWKQPITYNVTEIYNNNKNFSALYFHVGDPRK